MDRAEKVDSEARFRADWPAHAAAIFDYVRGDPALTGLRFVQAVVRAHLPTITLDRENGDAVYLSAAGDDVGGWSVIVI